ncbi:ABC transporter substrate-binding protein [Brevibacillus sp. NRS-1366]|uniref:ABC transporter substrate-binding protein n=1 Tax=Brevibacillus sp. NRS-1366 TaxID=3233899 RepID=UPI003D201B66
MLLLSVTMLVSACGSGGGDAASGGQSAGQEAGQASGGTKEALKIGAIFPFTGANALLGDESFRGLELAVKMRNKNGGVAGGKTVEIVKGDAPDANAAQSEANRLIQQENLKLITGSYSSAVAFAASEVTERNGVLFWEMGGISDKITERGYQYVFRANPRSATFQEKHLEFIQKELAPKLNKKPEEVKIAIVHEDSLNGATGAQYFEKIAKVANMNIVTVQSYSAKSVDLSSVVLNVKNAQPDVIVMTSYLNDSILFVRQAKELGLNVTAIVGTGGGYSMKDFQKSVGKDAEGIFSLDFPQYKINTQFTPGLEDFQKLYKETYGEEPRSGHSLANFVSANALLDVLDKAGEVDPDKLRDEIIKLNVEPGKTANGWGMHFDSSNGQNILGTPYVHQWQNGELVGVWPKEIAVKEMLFPMPKWEDKK